MKVPEFTIKATNTASYILVAVVSIIITFFVTKSIYQIELPPIPQPKNEIQKKTIDIPELKITPRLTVTEHKEVKPRLKQGTSDSSSTSIAGQIVYDTTRQQVVTAEADTMIYFTHNLQFDDTTHVPVTDTLKLRLKYLFPPVNEFQIKARLSISNSKRTEYKPVEVQKPEGFFDRFQFGIGVGYSTPLSKVDFQPSIFIGIYYKIKLSFF